MIGIYRITSPSGKVYIGQSWNMEKRLAGYKQPNYSSSQTKLIRSLRKYGYATHSVDIVVVLSGTITQKELDYYEILWIKMEKNLGHVLLNIKEGGSKGKNSPETRLKISLARRADKTKRILKPEHIEAIKKHNKGKIHTEQAKINMSVGQKKVAHLTSERISKPILQYTKEGNFVAEWGSLTEAAKGIGLKTPASICSAAKGDYKSAKGYIWKYKTNQ